MPGEGGQVQVLNIIPLCKFGIAMPPLQFGAIAGQEVAVVGALVVQLSSFNLPSAAHIPNPTPTPVQGGPIPTTKAPQKLSNKHSQYV